MEKNTNMFMELAQIERRSGFTCKDFFWMSTTNPNVCIYTT